VFGDAGNGASQSRTFIFADLALTNASQLALLVNIAEPGPENPPSVMTAASPLATNGNLANAITLNAYSASGTLLEQHVANAGLTLNQVAAGLGGSGIVFALTAAEQTQLNNTMRRTPAPKCSRSEPLSRMRRVAPKPSRQSASRLSPRFRRPGRTR